MEIKDLKIEKYLCGIFFEEDYSYDSKKGDFFNNVKTYFLKKDKRAQFQLVTNVLPGDVMVNQKNKLFKITTGATSLHYENDSTKDDFITDCTKIYEFHRSVFSNSALVRLGFIVYFQVQAQTKEKQLLRNSILNNFQSHDFKSLDIHLNYEKKLNDQPYNVNLNLHDDNAYIKGDLDINLTASEDLSLNQDNLKPIFIALNNYYSTEFITEFIGRIK